MSIAFHTRRKDTQIIYCVRLGYSLEWYTLKTLGVWQNAAVQLMFGAVILLSNHLWIIVLITLSYEKSNINKITGPGSPRWHLQRYWGLNDLKEKRQKKSDFGPRRVRSFSNSPTVDSAKERICNAGFTPGAEAPRRAKGSQAPPIHPPVKPLCGSHGLRCAAPRAAPMVSALSLFFALDASLSRQETHWKMILNDINDIFYMICDIN